MLPICSFRSLRRASASSNIIIALSSLVNSVEFEVSNLSFSILFASHIKAIENTKTKPYIISRIIFSITATFLKLFIELASNCFYRSDEILGITWKKLNSMNYCVFCNK